MPRLFFAVLSMFFGSPAMMSAEAKGFLVEKKGALRSKADAYGFDKEIQNAMGEALGCGGVVTEEHLIAIEGELATVWRVLPKNAGGRVERRSLRYFVYRYFMQRSSLMIRGFEPVRPVNQSGWGDADILSQRVPAYVESVLEAQHRQDLGFGLRDAAYLVATIEQLIFDSEGSTLERVFESQRKPLSREMSKRALQQVLEEYMLRWIIGSNVDFRYTNRQLLEQSIPNWDELVHFADGQIQALDFQRQRSATPMGKSLARHYTFDDAHEIVGGITKSFASYWESECTVMKEQLVAMDSHHTGRVPLAKFHGNGLDKEWRFAESESYLRDLGALDETSSWRGKQVIIANYIQGASNCIVATDHYLVCCANDCESILADIEGTIGAPVADPQEILELVGNMSSHVSIDLDEPPSLKGSLTSQLYQIAEAHSGKVPLHGRLFAQWLHYAFPRECPFPHKSGSAAALSPSEYGESYIASEAEMKEHALGANSSDVPSTMERDDLHWMSQWSMEEELLGDYVGELRAPWERSRFFGCGAVLLGMAALAGIVGVSRKAGASEPHLLPLQGKAHFV